MADLFGDRLENEDYGDSDVWSVTDMSCCSSDVDEQDNCNLNMISVTDREINIYDGRLCLLCRDGTAVLRDLRGAPLDDHRMDHSRTVSWDPGYRGLSGPIGVL